MEGQLEAEVSHSTTGPALTTREQSPATERAGWPAPVANSLPALQPGQARWAAVNLGLIGLVLLLEYVPVFGRGHPSSRVVGIFAGAGALQFADWAWLLCRGKALSRRAATTHFKLTLAFNVLLAFVLAMCLPLVDIQYGLLVLPAVIAITLRYGLLTGIGFSLVAFVFSFMPPQEYLTADPAERETTLRQGIVLVASYVVVAIVVDTLCGAVVEEARRLRGSLRDLRQAKARLVAHEKLAAVGRLSASIAHEIRNPIAMIASSLELAAEPGTAEEVRRDMLRIAREESARMNALTTDFLAYAQSKPPQWTHIHVSDALEAVASLAKARASQAGVELRVDCPPDLQADFDQLQVHQALLNLTINAIEASPSGGSVTLGGQAAGRGVELWVENAGDPIAPAAVGRLFEPFFTTKPQGSGLGLPTARNTAIAHGGDLFLAHNEPGRIRFVVRIPGRTDGAHPDR
jgi:signal transduction histidine kinase